MSLRKTIIALALFLAGAAILAAVFFPTSREVFHIPIAFTFSEDNLLVAEKDNNTILRLTEFCPEKPMRLLERQAIEPQDDQFYYMVRHLYPTSDGVMVHSYVYDRKTTDFTGYRFNLYRSFSEPPETVFTIFPRDPEEAPELRYAAGPDGKHYFANNCRDQYCIWRLAPEARGVVMRKGVVPDSLQELGKQNGEFSFWMSIFVNPEETIYLASGQDDQIVVFSPKGEQLGSIGKQGRNPRFLMAPAEVFMLSPNEGWPAVLAVASTGNRDWVLFNREGAPARIIEPLDNGYPHPDILVGRIFRINDENLTFDLANKCLVFPKQGFQTVNYFRAISQQRLFFLLIPAVVLIIAILLRNQLGTVFRRFKFPVFSKLVLIFIPLITGGLIISARSRKIGYQAYLDETTLRAANLATAMKNSIPLADLEKIDRPEDRETQNYENIFSIANRLIDRKNVKQSPKWIIHKIEDGRYYFGINAWRGPIFEPFIVPADREMFREVLKNKKAAWGRFIDDQGEWLSYLLPIVNEKGKVINVIEIYRSTEEMGRVEQEAFSKVKENALAIVIAFTLLALVFSWLFVRRLKRLSAETRAISRGDFDRKIIDQSRLEPSQIGDGHLADD